MDNDGITAEPLALGLQLSAQGAVIVDLAIEADDIAAVARNERLCPALTEVLYRQASVCEAHAAIRRNPYALAIWPPRALGITGEDQLIRIDGVGRVMMGKQPRYSTRAESLSGLSVMIE